MREVVFTDTRDQLILFGRAVAWGLHAADPQRQWTLALDGAFKGGKSLIALGMDAELNPQRYPSGITEDCSADEMLKVGNNGRPQLVFHNGLPDIPLIPTAEDCKNNSRFNWYKEQNPDARFFILSNVREFVTVEKKPVKGIARIVDAFVAARWLGRDPIHFDAMVKLELRGRHAEWEFYRTLELICDSGRLVRSVIARYNEIAMPSRPHANARGGVTGPRA